MRRLRLALAGIAAAAAAGLLLAGPIPQPGRYHEFADRRAWLGIPNAADVLSNAPFLVVGIAGLAAAARDRAGGAPGRSVRRAGFVVASAGILLTAFGSTAYHWAPTDATLVWDRLPIAVAAAATSALFLEERHGHGWTPARLFALVAAGVLGVVHWAWTCRDGGGGDLRLFLYTRNVPVLAAFVALLASPEPRATRGPALATFAFFAAATALEAADAAVFRTTGGVVGGHALKHVAAAAAAASFVAWYARSVSSRTGS